jgi:YVTN family beta-propeller protein
MRNLFRVLSLAVFMLVLASASAFAGITSSSVNHDVNQMTITGNGFPLKNPVVKIYGPTVYSSMANASNNLPIVANSRTSITVQLPTLEPGTYKITVSNGLTLIGRFDFTYGAADVADVTTLTTSLNAETTRAEGAETGLAASIGTEITRAEGAEGTLSTGLAAEISRANGAEDCLKSKIDGLQGAVKGTAALMQWYPVTNPVAGNKPNSIAFDGTNVWVVTEDGSVAQGQNNTPGHVQVLNAVTGAPTSFSPVTVGKIPDGIAYDGTNMWVANWIDNTVTEINASTGAIVNTIAVGTNPDCVTFDGAKNTIWVGDYYDGKVDAIDASSGSVVDTVTAGNSGDVGLNFMTFDGTNIWTANADESTVSRIKASTGAASTISVAGSPAGIAFDGANVWTANQSGTLSVINPATMAIVNTINVPGGPYGIAFDGINMWVTQYSGGTVSEINGSTGAVMKTFTVGAKPQAATFDGANIWVANVGSNTVTRIPAR